MASQGSLFGSDALDGSVSVRFRADFASWRPHLLRLLREGIEPDAVWWEADESHDDDRVVAADPVRDESASAAADLPPRFWALARLVACNRDPRRWWLLHAVAWRLVRGEPHLLELSADRQVAALNALARSVRRDLHKMKAFVRFREVSDSDACDADQARYIAWFEPQHHIVALAAPFFVRRFANMRWSILTPSCCAHYEGTGRAWISAGVPRDRAPRGDRFEEAWRVYFRSIFNPARLKQKAMTSEMAKKYWKNLPEAVEIPALVRDAGRRVSAMESAHKEQDRLHCGPRPATPEDTLKAGIAASPRASLERLRLSASHCQRCELWHPATQTVFGEGPANARLVILGEQPGDREDLEGRPFVGPAGRLLEQALGEAGISRDETYLTNAVKHFRFTPRGKRRLHKKPSLPQVRSCMTLLSQELQLVDPDLVVCLGATAGFTQLGAGVRVRRDRGQVLSVGGRSVLLTVHPSYILRIDDARRRDSEFEQLVADLCHARAWLACTAA